ncbi:unnamed protein product [Adineta steineri]|uniref:Uncharacterized protein n=1 Tax=Adineta steineri TaxID=433720 RepID=A0A813ZEK9_9BILA|nr:unnamed protein product [Adineta steineri]CAF3486357.1 unnamed protein product [Adineta steineri]
MLYIKKQQTSSLAASKELVPLKEVRVDARIHSFAADVTLTQVFQNDESMPVEAVYCFPVEENAAIYAFVAHIDDEREIVAELKEKKIAQQEYSQALAHGHGAYLLEQDEASNDVFIVSVGALKPNSKCRITISYVSELDLLHDNNKPTIRFVIPTTIAPRYSPVQKGIASPGGTQVQYAESVPYTIEFQCHVDKLGQNIAGVSSPSHPIKVDLSNPELFLIGFSQEGVQLDRDIIVDIELSEMKTNTIAASEKGALMISFMPNEQDCQQSMDKVINEFLFVIDCSGSMEGDNKIGLARKAMILFLKSLPVNCHFNIIRFGSTFSSLFDKQVSVQYNEKTMRQAESLIKNMSADLGGTELLQPFEWLKKSKPQNGCIRQIFLLTDGEVSNVDEITKLCSEMAAYTRIFSFGLGHSPSRTLVKGLARATNGHFTFIPPNTSVNIHVAEQLARALRPNLTNISAKWQTNQKVLYSVSEHLSSVFVGDRLLFYALLDESIPFDDKTTVELISKQYQEPLSVVSIEHAMSNCSPQTITRLAAKAILSQFQHVSKNTPKELLVDLSIKYGILCPYTAFIGVERRLDANNESNIDMELREIAIMPGPKYQRLLSSSQSYRSSSMSSARFNSLQSQVDDVTNVMRANINLALTRGDMLDTLEYQADLLSCNSLKFHHNASQLKRKSSMGFGSLFGLVVNFASSFFTQKDVVPQMAATSITDNQSQQDRAIDWPTDEQQLVERFIDRQQYDGLWMLTENDVKQLTSKSLVDFSSSVLDTVEKKNQQLIITTILAIVILEMRCVSSKTLWQTLSNKAQKRLLELLSGDQTKLEQYIKCIRDQLI